MQTSTHDLTIKSDEVRKRFVEWDRGEAEREWACLTVLADHAPGLAPRPLRREEEDGAPVVVMERLPGRPLGGAALTSDPAYELADHVEHLAARPRGYDAVALADAVGLHADDRQRMAAYRPLWAVFWLAMLLPGRDVGSWHRNPPGTAEAQAAHFLALVGEL